VSNPTGCPFWGWEQVSLSAGSILLGNQLEKDTSLNISLLHCTAFLSTDNVSEPTPNTVESCDGLKERYSLDFNKLPITSRAFHDPNVWHISVR
jgi:hypothetical protein